MALRSTLSSRAPLVVCSDSRIFQSRANRCFVKLMKLYLPDRVLSKQSSRTSHVSANQPLGKLSLIALEQILRVHPCKASSARMDRLPNPPWQVRTIFLIVSTPCPCPDRGAGMPPFERDRKSRGQGKVALRLCLDASA